MRLRQLRSALHAFCEEAAWQLASDTHEGHEVPFEVIEGGRRDAPLYCYRPLTAAFIRERTGVLGRLPGYLPAAHALVAAGRLDDWLDAQGVHAPPAGRERADAALHCFLARVFEDSTDFVFHEERFDHAFREFERLVTDGRAESLVVLPVLGLEIVSDEVTIGEGLTLVRGDACAEAPDEARWARADGRPQTLAVIRWEPAAGDPSPLGHARVRLRRLLVGLRLYDAVAVSAAPLGWTRTEGGPWQPLAIGATPGPDGHLVIAPEHEDELRAFLSLIGRRTPRHGEVAWALRRYELACERPQPAEALSDVLLALRALLEPEGTASGRLAGRLAALCAEPADRARVAERVAHTVSLERAVVAGLAVDPQLERLTAELSGHLRALLRDVLCGHLDPDLRTLADTILAAEPPARDPAPAPPPLPAADAEPPARPPARQDTFF
ncbi:MAG: hypothetical protein MUC84_02375 [Solirubrobacteraceae bacterium]|jgi:hypothetical protein|nr:hypothetical protein [Solirubrobacteraceae bacterium]MCU0312892.1 hypothetical protein [Solirubrobacteraceae bacterium]